MDIVSHGLRSGLAFGRKNKKDFLKSIGRGILPDALSFGVFTGATILGLSARPDRGNHDATQIPEYVHTLYNITHSFFTFGIALGLAYLWKKKIPLPMLGRGLHILVDIPTHSLNFFGTPFLRPLFPPLVDGISRGNPWIFFSNRGILILGYGRWRIRKKKKIVIQNLSPSDIEKCLEIRIRNYKEVNKTPEKIAGVREYFLSTVNERNYFVAKENKKIVGIGGYQKNQLYSFFIDPDYQGKGIGKLLLEKVLLEIKNLGYKEAILHSSKYAKSFYEHYGFFITAEKNNEYIMKKIF